MCLGVPGKVIEIYETEGLKMGKIDFGGVVREACLAYVPEIEVGEYTVIHVGFAISQLSEEEAQATLEILNELADLQEEIGPEPEFTPGPQHAPRSAKPSGSSALSEDQPGLQNAPRSAKPSETRP